MRAARLLAARRGEFDVVHDNQCLGTGLLTIEAEPAIRYLDRTAEALTQNSVYIGKVMNALPVGEGHE